MNRIAALKSHKLWTRHVEEVLRRWDPIGVIVGTVEDGCPVDEYDSYAPHFVTLLSHGCSVDELADHLESIRVESIGLPAFRSSDLAVASNLVTWWSERWPRDIGAA